MPVKVYIVGAGPGNPELLTLAAHKAISSAEVILHDYLVSKEILEFANSEAEVISVGKKKGVCAKTQQEDIHKDLVKHAKAGKKVVRLKGGDPFIFGRGAEECLALFEAGIEFEVIPGISSAIPTNALIPLTHRECASNFAVFSGHRAKGKEYPEIDWELAAKIDTAVFLMSVKPLEFIAAQLLKYGRNRNEPVAIVRNSSLNSQEVITGNLDNIVLKAKHLEAPAVIVVGKVASVYQAIKA